MAMLREIEKREKAPLGPRVASHHGSVVAKGAEGWAHQIPAVHLG